ncbi:hypothetical protein SDC9_137393 [bioreactor metagenome]|uniref:Uncharacterized protein n=1 Tax=bioreactor metagenome TaxID=1076179 RepID=A0A645DP14_9ZZZZ
MVNVVSTTRHRRAQKTVRNIPVFHRIKMRQQCFIERLYCLRIGEINTLLPAGREGEKLRQLWGNLA